MYVCVHVSALECGCSRGQEEGVRFLRAGVAEGCGSPGKVSGTELRFSAQAVCIALLAL